MSASEQNPDFTSSKSLDGFDKLWDISLDDAVAFVEKKEPRQHSDKLSDELRLLRAELKHKEFETQKLQWQLREREKELRNLYAETHEVLDLNKSLNQQLKQLENLVNKI